MNTVTFYTNEQVTTVNKVIGIAIRDQNLVKVTFKNSNDEVRIIESNLPFIYERGPLED